MSNQHNLNVMRYFYIFFLLSLPFSTEATTRSAPDPASVYQPSFLVKQDGKKRGFLKRFAEKTLLKRLKKAADRSSSGDGKWLAISGFAIGLLGVLPWIFSYESAVFVFFAFPMIGLLGLPLSIFGLIKARSWDGTGFTIGLAIAGIALNGLLVVLSIWAITQF